MNGKRAKRLRALAEALTVGEEPEVTEYLFHHLKRGFHAAENLTQVRARIIKDLNAKRTAQIKQRARESLKRGESPYPPFKKTKLKIEMERAFS